MSIQTSPAAKALVDHLHDCDRQAGYRMESLVAPLPGMPPKDVTLFVPIRLMRDLEAEFLGVNGPDLVTTWTSDRQTASQNARAQGFTGDACPNCGNFAMRQAGTCATCTACGETTGCS
ncbi:hypothetical protein BA190_10005 [Labrys sp. WJW]|uniref:hypothetical protein n=1 Tax=Labrys sp. WJW TaxID=1737983 RepID=UPI00082B1CF9|nr:hypothetical protein [Labrys sp. WJW]OCC05227.1 hypothetical protein BA190_10005 [Labrys sp. WJW]